MRAVDSEGTPIIIAVIEAPPVIVRILTPLGYILFCGVQTTGITHLEPASNSAAYFEEQETRI